MGRQKDSKSALIEELEGSKTKYGALVGKELSKVDKFPEKIQELFKKVAPLIEAGPESK